MDNNDNLPNKTSGSENFANDIVPENTVNNVDAQTFVENIGESSVPSGAETDSPISLVPEESTDSKSADEIIEEILGEDTIPEVTENSEVPSEGGLESKDEENMKQNKSVSNTIVSEIFDWAGLISVSLAFVVILFTFIFRIVTVDGSSMNKTLTNGDKMIISNMMFKPSTGDIIVFVPSAKYYSETPFVKRVIGVAGDKIFIDKASHKVYVNDKPIDEPYINGTTLDMGNQKYPLTVPEGYLFVMGDNRLNSRDSRYTDVGFADERLVLGHAIARIYPINQFKLLG